MEGDSFLSFSITFSGWYAIYNNSMHMYMYIQMCSDTIFVCSCVYFAGDIVPGSAEFYSSHCDHVLPGLLLCRQPCLSGTQGGCSPQLQVGITCSVTVEEKVITGKRGPFTCLCFCSFTDQHFKYMLVIHVSTGTC